MRGKSKVLRSAHLPRAAGSMPPIVRSKRPIGRPIAPERAIGRLFIGVTRAALVPIFVQRVFFTCFPNQDILSFAFQGLFCKSFKCQSSPFHGLSDLSITSRKIPDDKPLVIINGLIELKLSFIPGFLQRTRHSGPQVVLARFRGFPELSSKIPAHFHNRTCAGINEWKPETGALGANI